MENEWAKRKLPRLHSFDYASQCVYFITICTQNREPCLPLPTIPTIIGQYKSGVSRKCKRPLWQQSYHDHIIRNQLDFEETWKYIDNNPLQWVLDGKA